MSLATPLPPSTPREWQEFATNKNILPTFTLSHLNNQRQQQPQPQPLQQQQHSIPPPPPFQQAEASEHYYPTRHYKNRNPPQPRSHKLGLSGSTMREDDHIFLHILRKQDETNFFNIKKLLFESEYANQKSWDAALVTLSLDEVADNENVLRLIRKATTDDVTKTLASERLAPKSSASSGTKSQSSPHPSLSNLHKQQKTTSTSKESLPPYTTPSSRTQRTPQAPRKSQHSSTITSINPEIHHYVDLMSHATTSQSSIPKIQLVDKCGIFELPLLNSYDIAKEVKSEVEKDDKKHDDNMGNNDGDNIYEGLARWTDPLVSPTPASKGPSSKPPRSLLSSEHSDVDSEEEEEEEFGIPISERRRLSITATDGEAIINNFASNFCTALCKYVKPSSPGSPFISNPLSSRTHTDTNGNHVSRTYRMVPIQQKFSFGPTRRNDKNNWGFNAAVDAVIRTDCNQGHFQSLQAKGKEGKVKDEKAHIRKPKREISYNEQGKMPCLPLLCAEFKASSEPKDIYIQEDAELAAIIYEKWYGMGRDGVEDKDDSSREKKYYYHCMFYQYGFLQGVILARYTKKWVDYIGDRENKVILPGGGEEDEYLRIQRMGQFSIFEREDIYMIMMVMISIMIADMNRKMYGEGKEREDGEDGEEKRVEKERDGEKTRGQSDGKKGSEGGRKSKSETQSNKKERKPWR